MADNILGIKSIMEHNKENPMQIFRFIFTRDWIFSTALEKIIVLGCFGFTVYSIIKFAIGLF